MSQAIALVAHDNMKPALIEWVQHHQSILSQFELIATGSTGSLIHNATSMPINRLESGPLGGDQQLGALIVEQKIKLVIFFWDPLEAQPHDPDVRALLRIAAVWNIPTACNMATADYLIHSTLLLSDYQPLIPDYNAYRQRRL